jgi:GTP-binding protein
MSYKFMYGVTSWGGLPSEDLPEVAFIGRSNVGKSSLINGVSLYNSLARVSKTPGATQQLNFFAFLKQDIPAMFLVDLPGYGYAKAAKSKVLSWNKFMLEYLEKRPQLKRIFMLIDSRHGFMKIDQEMLNFLKQCGVLVQIILTKGDKISKTQLMAVKAGIEEEIKTHAICYQDVIASSYKTKEGMEQIRTAIMDACENKFCTKFS